MTSETEESLSLERCSSASSLVERMRAGVSYTSFAHKLSDIARKLSTSDSLTAPAQGTGIPQSLRYAHTHSHSLVTCHSLLKLEILCR